MGFVQRRPDRGRAIVLVVVGVSSWLGLCQLLRWSREHGVGGVARGELSSEIYRSRRATWDCGHRAEACGASAFCPLRQLRTCPLSTRLSRRPASLGVSNQYSGLMRLHRAFENPSTTLKASDRALARAKVSVSVCGNSTTRSLRWT
ncbi:uncharacterized protein B0I36DRAFT_355956 [Microdochium trichocladiopsis]|uniref:Uncharacterized protein n=1 Tax=Microdochium trichocladiopsis TaxID=1682393 RepID=A0A9P8XU46_9PEZI|nr:uncharacterized protein B0I36DRAFT_355956 [Microdochium trichocladiopsis]KAH7012559.1 hypothetical protein B0I36DRAFT_355956 [Microdochium trichocladiopsis]